MPYPKGFPKPAHSGRKKGTPNKSSGDIKAFALSILEDPKYQQNLRRRILNGQGGKIEELLYHYGYGKPQESMKISGSLTLEQLVTGMSEAGPT